MKTFDFELAIKQGRNPQVVQYFKDNHEKKITEEQFIKSMKSLKIHALGKKYKYSPSYLKHEYKNLKKNFGFFK